MIFNCTGARLFYEKSGHGRPIILLYGNGESHKIFNKAIAVLEKNLTVYAIDSRGHGQSSPARNLSYLDMAKDIYEFICGLSIERPIVYGFSDGGIIALYLGINYPSLLSEIIASGANIQPDGLKRSFLFYYRLLHFFTRSNKLLLMLTEPNITKEMLQEIVIPVAITGGSRDVIRKAHLKEIADNIPNSTLDIFKGETHSSYVVDSEKIAVYIIDRITENGGGFCWKT